jgi:DNA-binding protein HU-beta
MTQSEIISALAEQSGMKKSDVKGFLEGLATMATSEVKKNGEFTLPGFGKLRRPIVKHAKAAIRRPAR